MRYAMVMAGGSGTRLWPMSTRDLPKQLIPFIDGRSLLQVAMERLEGLVPQDRRLVCAGEHTKAVMLDKLPGLSEERFFGEPTGRDTLNAVGYVAAVLAKRDPEAAIAVFTADHLIEPVDQFQKIVERGFDIAEAGGQTLVTFGIAPTEPATGFGYLQLGEKLDDGEGSIVDEFKEKPEQSLANQYLEAGPEKYLWNSGMFVWQASSLLAAIEKFHPENHAGLMKIAQAYDTDQRDAVVAEVYPGLPKISVDFAVMEPASRDDAFTVAAVPMPLSWLDVGSWPSFAGTRKRDDAGNAAAAKHTLIDTKNTLVASDDPDHLITTIGVEDMIVIHTKHATLVCPADQAQRIKELHGLVGEQHGDEYR
jgi:mannose-1-phosphate guanylyltransferase